MLGYRGDDETTTMGLCQSMYGGTPCGGSTDFGGATAADIHSAIATQDLIPLVIRKTDLKAIQAFT